MRNADFKIEFSFLYYLSSLLYLKSIIVMPFKSRVLLYIVLKQMVFFSFHFHLCIVPLWLSYLEIVREGWGEHFFLLEWQIEGKGKNCSLYTHICSHTFAWQTRQLAEIWCCFLLMTSNWEVLLTRNPLARFINVHIQRQSFIVLVWASKSTATELGLMLGGRG